ncbi:hypothetical protein NQZ68_010932 [Dissostichus eleginoides]|nr:hypothetical protein NQZ68_010932 [Dissostichus eleginoides]
MISRAKTLPITARIPNVLKCGQKNRQLNPKGPADDLWLESWRKETTDLTVTNRVQLQVQFHQERVPNQHNNNVSVI